MAKILIAWTVGERLGLGRPPGDIVIERGGMRVYLLSLALWLFNR
jgi:hypothetical protein